MSEVKVWSYHCKYGDGVTNSKFFYFSMASIVSTEQGEEVSDRLWKETIEELSFADVERILRTVKD